MWSDDPRRAALDTDLTNNFKARNNLPPNWRNQMLAPPPQQRYNMAPQYNGPAPPPPQVLADPAVPQLFVSNVHYECSVDELGGLFRQYGPIVSFHLLPDHVQPRRRRRHKGYGFVTFAYLGSVDEAQRGMDGYMINNRPISVRFARRYVTAG
jgi:hypothetical protein